MAASEDTPRGTSRTATSSSGAASKVDPTRAASSPSSGQTASASASPSEASAPPSASAASAGRRAVAHFRLCGVSQTGD